VRVTTILSDVRDGLTAPCREALCALYDMRATTSKYVKSARFIETMLRDARTTAANPGAIYDELVRMAQDFRLRYPLVDGQGNFGSIDDDPPAEMKYTEVRLAPIAAAMLCHLDLARHDNASGWPVPVPAGFPNLLVNGSFSVAGDGSSIPPHNLREVVDGTIAYLENPDIDVAGLMTHLRGPDFATGGVVHGRRDVAEFYETGRGCLRVRAKTHTEQVWIDHEEATEAIIVTELPPAVSKGGEDGAISSIVESVIAKKITGITDIADESFDPEMRIVITLNRGESPRAVLDQIYDHTPLQRRLELNMVTHVDGAARCVSLPEAIAHYVAHQQDVLARQADSQGTQQTAQRLADDLRDIAERYEDPRRTEIR
jgi:DNA gyrase subunit A